MGFSLLSQSKVIILNHPGGKAIKDLIIYIVKTLVDQPDLVSVTEVVSESTKVLELRVANGDMGMVISNHDG